MSPELAVITVVCGVILIVTAVFTLLDIARQSRKRALPPPDIDQELSFTAVRTELRVAAERLDRHVEELNEANRRLSEAKP